MLLSRRSMFAGLAVAICAPAVIRTPGLIMPIKPLKLFTTPAIDTTGANLLVIVTNDFSAHKVQDARGEWSSNWTVTSGKLDIYDTGPRAASIAAFKTGTWPIELLARSTQILSPAQQLLQPSYGAG